MKPYTRLAVAAALCLVASSAALAQSTSLPDTASGTTFSANVTEQATVSVPTAVAFDVRDLNEPTDASPTSVEITSIALSPGHQLRVSIAPDAATFAAPGGGTSWRSDQVRWNASAGDAWTGAADTMADAPGLFTRVATCAPGANACATSELVFTLNARLGGAEAGQHTLTATWKIESL